VETEERRRALRAGFRLAAAAALGAVAAVLGLRRSPGGAKDAGYCDRAGRCAGCPVTAKCDAFEAMHGGPER
jgi:hypothetical protein